jgi:signal transduction histidine kinase
MRIPLPAKFLILVIAGVFLPLLASALIFFHLKRGETEQAFLRQGRIMVNQVVIMRRWLADQGGVYIAKRPSVKPSEFMDHADTATIEGEPLILRSPETVTREISEMAAGEGVWRFRMVSQTPINPDNRPDAWEEASLRQFAAGVPETSTVIGEDEQARYRYMAPLRTEKSCLRCHQEFPYAVGQVRGGISVEFPIGELMAEEARVNRGYLILAMVLGVALIAVLYGTVRRWLLLPLQEVRAAVSGLATGDYERALTPRSRDELGDLAATVIEVRRIIRDYNHQLEAQVAERTRELERLLAALTDMNRTLEAKVREQTGALVEQEKLAALGEVSAGLAHEIRNPLSAILSGISLLENDRRTLAERQHITKLIRREAGRLNSTLTDFLLFARPHQPKRVRIDLAGLTREIVQMIEEDPELKGDAEIILLLAEMPPIWFDDDQLRQLIWNMVLNGLQALAGKGQLIVHTRDLGRGAWQLDVQDTGPGIPPEVLPRIFEPFFSTKKDGTGLGLAIVRRIIRAHRGDIRIENMPGGGCRATITAPAPPDDHG